MNDLLLDTCAALWMLSEAALQRGTEDAIAQAVQAGGRLFISPISAWEVGLLLARGKLTLPFSPNEWYARLTALSDQSIAPLTETILIASHFLPGTPPKDPMDRLMIAAARDRGLRIVTRDRLILSYAERGHVMALPC